QDCGGGEPPACDPNQQDCGGSEPPACDPNQQDCGGSEPPACDPNKQDCGGSEPPACDPSHEDCSQAGSNPGQVHSGGRAVRGAKKGGRIHRIPWTHGYGTRSGHNN
ncbi:MAG TPA: hypothetical protein VNI57_05590, partial [Candidatus Saccharimonadales bacterium]|nr:hypothetical protein [Candidatus Saccharimonadales bacterium]